MDRGSASQGEPRSRAASPPPSTSHFSTAAAHDAAARHDAAINELARGTRAGDLACTRQLGLRLLIGDRAPALREEGLGLIEDVCRQGFGEAAARAAGLLALGIRGTPDLPGAMAWLVRSATLGWSPAQRQLIALCDDRELAATAQAAIEAGATGAAWQRLASAVRMDAWRRSPAPLLRSAEPRVATFTDFLRPEVCRLLISLATGRLEPARVYDAASGSDVVDAHRSNTIATFGVFDVELVHALVQMRMAAACGVSETQMEAPTVLHYSPGEQIRDHYDFVDPHTVSDYPAEIARRGQRVITFIVYLNDDYDGGATAFPKLGFEHKGRCGEGIYFTNALADLAPDMRMLHAGRPPTSGEKWIVTQFVRSRATR